MNKWKGRSLWAEIATLTLATALAACCLFGTLSWPVSAWAQQATGTPAQPQQQLSPLAAELEAFRFKGYAVLGPITLTQYDARKLAVYQLNGDLVIDLRDKTFTVKDGNARPTSVDAIKRGAKVYVCAGLNEVVLYVLEKKEGPANVAR